MNDLNVTLIQADIAWEKKSENLKNFSERIEMIESPSDLVILPEMFTTGFTMKAEKYAEDFNGDTIRWMKNVAVEKNTHILGSIIISVNGKFYNRLVLVSPDENIQYYDKRHLFRMGNEHHNYSAGSKRMIADVNRWKICPMICYDLRFPVWSRNLNEYDLLIYIANWPEIRREVWLTLLMARAIENQCYVAGVNRIGVDGNAIAYAGDSVIVSPSGNIISDTKPYKESVETIPLSMEYITELRQKFPVGLDADNFQII